MRVHVLASGDGGGWVAGNWVAGNWVWLCELVVILFAAFLCFSAMHFSPGSIWWKMASAVLVGMLVVGCKWLHS